MVYDWRVQTLPPKSTSTGNRGQGSTREKQFTHIKQVVFTRGSFSLFTLLKFTHLSICGIALMLLNEKVQFQQFHF